MQYILPAEKPPALVIAGTHSGCGKTTITLSLMASLASRGVKIAPFKVGPDFIDPGLHEIFCNRPSYNLDSWMMDKESLIENFIYASKGADIAIIEGVMGLFDGAFANNEIGSTAHVAKLLNLPILLVVDARSMARSIAALIKGYLDFDKKLNICAVLINKISSKRHKEILEEATKTLNIPFIGFINKKEDITLPSRHLGLITATEYNNITIENLKKDLSILIKESINLDHLITLVKHIKTTTETIYIKRSKTKIKYNKNRKIKVAVAYDKAFCFYYKRNLDILEALGANIHFFSPIANEKVPEDASALYLGGGYPELYKDILSENKTLHDQILSLAEKGLPILAECGGFMFLNKGIYKDDIFYDWVGLFPLEFKMASSFKALGYRRALLKKRCVIGKEGITFKGHEFRYSFPINLSDSSESPFYSFDARGNEVFTPGFIYKNCFASYIHIHFDSNLNIATSFIKASEEYSNK